MPAVTIRNLPEETFRALQLRAAQHGRSIETELHEIIEAAVGPPERLKLGSALARIGQEFGGVELDVTRDATAAGTVKFE